MEENQPPEPPVVSAAVPAAPPTVPGEIVVRRRAAVWPTPLGIVYIAFGVFGGAMGLIQAISSRWSMQFVRGMPGTEAAVAGMEQYGDAILATQIGAAVCGGLLVVAGVLVLMHRRRAVTVAMWWAGLKLVNSIGAVIVTGITQKMQMDVTLAQAMQQKASQVPPGLVARVSVATVAGMVLFTFAWLAALPLFTLIWFRLKSVRETVAGWRP